jgi:RNA polymerase-interacting CarD/CdnL/TRCF family regulator
MNRFKPVGNPRDMLPKLPSNLADSVVLIEEILGKLPKDGLSAYEKRMLNEYLETVKRALKHIEDPDFQELAGKLKERGITKKTLLGMKAEIESLLQ